MLYSLPLSVDFLSLTSLVKCKLNAIRPQYSLTVLFDNVLEVNWLSNDQVSALPRGSKCQMCVNLIEKATLLHDDEAVETSKFFVTSF